MKKFLAILLLSVLVSVVYSEGSQDPTPESRAAQATQTVQDRAITQFPVPMIKYFVERQTTSRWADTWDKPQVTTYVYLIEHGTYIGYYVCNGKPASTRSYLNPEFRDHVYGSSSAYSTYTEQEMDLDGTYGENNPGIRFFTAEGIAVEAGGNISYIYSNAKLPINVQRLNPVVESK